MKVALVYDRVNKWGGAERVLLHLHEMFPQAPLFTSVYSPNHAPWAQNFSDIKTSFLQKIPFTRHRHELLPLFMPMVFESFNFDNFDLVISVTSEAAKGIITRGKTKHICYCLTPTRYLWSGYETYFVRNDKLQITNNKWGKLRQIPDRVRNDGFKQLSNPAIKYLRRWDKIAAKRPDTMVGISTEVQDRIKRYYNRSSALIHPPVSIHKLEARISKFEKEKEYFLIVSRLVPYKKVDLVVETFNQLRLPLVVVGTGSQEKKLRKIAKGNIKIMGEVDEVELGQFYAYAKAFIFPQEEDFGITAVEAQAHGVPVIAFKKGGALDTVINRKTGVFFEEQTRESLGEAIRQFKDIRFKKEDLRKNARKFSKERFKKEFLTVLDKSF